MKTKVEVEPLSSVIKLTVSDEGDLKKMEMTLKRQKKKRSDEHVLISRWLKNLS